MTLVIIENKFIWLVSWQVFNNFKRIEIEYQRLSPNFSFSLKQTKFYLKLSCSSDLYTTFISDASV